MLCYCAELSKIKIYIQVKYNSPLVVGSLLPGDFNTSSTNKKAGMKARCIHVCECVCVCVCV